MIHETVKFRLLRPTSTLGLLLALALGQPGTAQELTLYEGMDYTGLETVHGKNGGAGWANPWVGIGENSLISWWPMDGSTADAGPMGNNATLQNGSFKFDVPPNLVWSNQSLSLKTNPRTLCDLSAYSLTFGTLMRGTISAWIKPVNSQSLMVVFGAANNSGKNLQLFIQSGLLKYEVKGGTPTGAKIEGSTDLMDGLWHHVAVTCNEAGFCTMYVDGNMETSGPVGFFGNILGVTGVWLGRTKTTIFTRFYRGEMDDVAIWGNCLTAADIQALASLPPPLVQGPTQPTGPTAAPQSLGSSAFPNAAFHTFDLEPVGNRFSDGSGVSAFRQLNSNTKINLSANKTTYLSCLMARTGNTTSPCEIHFTDPGGPRCRFGWNSSQLWHAGVEKTTVGPWMQPDTAYFVVFKIVAKSGTVPDQVFLQVYAPGDTITSTEPTTWTIASAGENYSNNLDAMWLKQLGSSSVMEVDEIRMGSTWNAVTSLGYGTGCLGNVISKLNRPAIGSTDYEVHLEGAEPTESAFLSLGVSRSRWGFTTLPLDMTLLGAPGCYVLASREATVPTTTDSNGAALLRLPIPNIASIVNRTIYAQWASIAPNSPNPFKLAFSNAMGMLIEN